MPKFYSFFNPYIKRFQFEASNKPQSYLGDNKDNKLILLTDTTYPRFEIIFGEGDSFRGSQTIEAEEFIAVKSFKAKGKRLTTFCIDRIEELEPLKQNEEPVPDDNEQEEQESENSFDTDNKSINLFNEES